MVPSLTALCKRYEEEMQRSHCSANGADYTPEFVEWLYHLFRIANCRTMEDFQVLTKYNKDQRIQG